MATYRFPILLLRDATGFHTAALVEVSRRRRRLRPDRRRRPRPAQGTARRLYRADPWRPEPDFEDPRLQTIKVDVRPEYKHADRIHPTSETIPLRCPLVIGASESGLRVAALPTLGIRFTYYADDDLKPLVTQYVQSRLKGHTPAQVAALLPPAHVELDDIVIHAPRADRRDRPEAAAATEPHGRRRPARQPRAAQPLQPRLAARRPDHPPGRGAQRKPPPSSSWASPASARPPSSPTPSAASSATPPPYRPRRAQHRRRPRSPLRPPAQHVHRFWLTAAPRIIAGMQYLGMWQERVEADHQRALPASAASSASKTSLDLVRTGGAGRATRSAAFLVPYLQRRAPPDRRGHPSRARRPPPPAPALADLFQVIPVPPFTRAQAIDCLTQSRRRARQNQKVETERRRRRNHLPPLQPLHALPPLPRPRRPFPRRPFRRATRRDADDRRVRPDDAIDLFVRRTGLPELLPPRRPSPLDTDSPSRRPHQRSHRPTPACEPPPPSSPPSKRASTTLTAPWASSSSPAQPE